MKILFVHSGADLYGASRSLLRLATRLTCDGHSVLVVLPYDGPLKSELEKQGVSVKIHTDLPVIDRQKYGRVRGLMLLAVNFLTNLFKFYSLVRFFRPDIIHTNVAIILSPGIIARLTRTPHVWHIRESFSEFPKLWRWYQRYMETLSDVIISVSTPIADQFDSREQTGKIRVIHNGFPKDEFNPVEPYRLANFRRKYQLRDDQLTVGVIGRIKLVRKGQEVFLRAAALLKECFPQARFLLIGSPFPGNEEHLNQVLRLAQELELGDHLIYTGDVEDIKAAYGVLDIVVLSSVQPEPFGGVVIEAMATGKPVVGTKIGGTIEQISDQENGFLVEPGNAEAMAEAIGKLLESAELRNEFGENGRRLFLEKFEFESFYKKILNVYLSLSTTDARSRETPVKWRNDEAT